ncbi:MAG: peptidylprolyl isomerase [Chloroflexi bacterium]|nr:peptidylprolyl isomerase [Chloroflexota bacterium]
MSTQAGPLPSAESARPDWRRAVQARRTGRERRVALLSGLLALLLALAIPGIGWYFVFVKPLGDTILRVGDRVYTMNQYVHRLRISVIEAQALGSQNEPTGLTDLVFSMVTEMENGAIVQRYAAEKGIDLTPEELQKEVRSRILGSRKQEDIPEEEFREIYRQSLNRMRVAEEEYLEVPRTALLRDKMRAKLMEEFPAEVEHVFVQRIQLGDVAVARKIRERIVGGEDFCAVALEVSLEEEAKKECGAWGWVPKTAEPPFDSTLFESDLQPGVVPEPVVAPYGVYLVRVTEGPALRETSEEHRKKIEVNILNAWAQERREELVAQGEIAVYVNQSQYDWTLRQLGQDKQLFQSRA